MSFIITLYVREGIVMASDSRLTLNNTRQHDDKSIVQLAVGQTDSNYKTFLAPGNIGISTFGDAEIEGVPLGGFMESFFNDKLGGSQDVETVANELLKYFTAMKKPPNTGFHVAGYKDVEGKLAAHVYRVNIPMKLVVPSNPKGGQGMIWDGEPDVITRLVQHVYTKGDDGKYSELPYYDVPFGFFTLQDAVDYAIYAVRSTIDTFRFQPRPKTVGGPIDVLVIKPTEAIWVQRKDLHGEMPREGVN